MILKIRKNYLIFGLVFLATFFIFGARVNSVLADNLGHGAAASIFTKPQDGTLFSYDWNNLLGYQNGAVYLDSEPLGSFVPTFLKAMMKGPLGIGREPVEGTRLTVQADGANNILGLYSFTGTEVMTVLNSGKVGIGTTNPGAKLDIKNSAGDGWLFNDSVGLDKTKIEFQENSGSQYSIYYDGTGAGTANKLKIEYEPSSLNLMTFDGTGNVGIATTTPGYRLTLGTPSPANYTMSAGGYRIANLMDPALNADAVNKGYVDSAFAAVSPLLEGGASSTWIVNGSNIYNANSGKVGIGTTNPGSKLEVAGNISLTASIDGSQRLRWYPDVNHSLYYDTDVDGITADVMTYYSDMLFRYRDTANQMVIKGATGYVGIGTTTPISKLMVYGSGQRIHIGDGTNNILVGQWDGSNNRIESSGNRKLLITSYYGGIDFGLNGSGGSLTIATSSNVGVGTNDPGVFKLNVAGNVYHSGHLSVGTTYNGFTANIGGTLYMTTGSIWTTDGYGYANSSSVNTGLFPDSTHNINIKTNNASAIYVKSGGNVGISTTTPGYRLTLGTPSPANYTMSAGNYRIGNVMDPNLNADAANKGYVDSAFAAVSPLLQGGASSTWIVNGNNIYNANSGNVGIGTIHPDELLTLAVNGKLAWEYTTGDNSAPFWITAGGINPMKFYWGPGSSPTYEAFKFTTWSGDALTILNNGNIGIATTTPGYRLTLGTPSPANYTMSAGGYRIANLMDPALNADAANKGYVDSAFAAVSPLLQGGASSTWIVNGNNIYNANSGNVGIGTTNPLQKFEVIGNIKSSANIVQGSTIARPLVSWSQVGAATGAVIITLPGTAGANHGMLQMEINVYEYNSKSATTFICGGHNWQNSWYNYSCSSIGLSDKKVRFGIKDGKYVVIIGETGSTWSYGHVVLSKITNPDFYAGNMDLSGPYVIALDNSAEAYTWISADLNRFNARNAYFNGSVGVGTASPNDVLHISNANDGVIAVQTGSTSLGSESGIKFKVTSNTEDNYYYAGVFAKRRADSLLDLHFATSNSNVNGTNAKMTILNEGNIGIGTTTPGYRLTLGTPSPANYTMSAGGYRIANLMDPALNADAANKGYVDSAFAAVAPGGASSTWALSGSNIYNTNSGNVGIGTSTPASDKLRVVGPVGIFGSLNLNNNNITGINKLTVNTIDPLYNIKGTNYSTFAAAIVGGVKEEYVGRTEVNKKRAFGDYEIVIDFSKQKEGSDLWVWRQTVDFSEENVEVFISALGDFARTYFLIEDEKIILRSDRPVKVSYRLVGRRLDWREWPTKALDQEEKAGFIID